MARHYRDMRVADVREPSGADYARVAFLESARFYRVSKQHASYARMLQLLREAQTTRRVLSIGLASMDSDLIEDVRDAGDA